MIDINTVAHYLGVDISDEEEKNLISGMIDNAYMQILIATNKDYKDTDEMAPIVNEIICASVYMSYYGARDDCKSVQHLQNYIDRNLASLSLLSQ